MAGAPLPRQAADVSHTRRAARKKAETGEGLRFRHEFRIRPLIFLQRHVVELLVVASERAVVHSLAAVVGERDHHLYYLARKRHGAVERAARLKHVPEVLDVEVDAEARLVAVLEHSRRLVLEALASGEPLAYRLEHLARVDAGLLGERHALRNGGNVDFSRIKQLLV